MGIGMRLSVYMWAQRATLEFMHDHVFDARAMGKRIESLSLKSGLSLRDIGTRARVGISTMSRIVNGRMPLVSVEVVVRICEALDVRLEWVVFGTGAVKR